jgi:hypothetical protein
MSIFVFYLSNSSLNPIIVEILNYLKLSSPKNNQFSLKTLTKYRQTQKKPKTLVLNHLQNLTRNQPSISPKIIFQTKMPKSQKQRFYARKSTASQQKNMHNDDDRFPYNGKKTHLQNIYVYSNKLVFTSI